MIFRKGYIRKNILYERNLLNFRQRIISENFSHLFRNPLYNNGPLNLGDCIVRFMNIAGYFIDIVYYGILYNTCMCIIYVYIWLQYIIPVILPISRGIDFTVPFLAGFVSHYSFCRIFFSIVVIGNNRPYRVIFSIISDFSFTTLFTRFQTENVAVLLESTRYVKYVLAACLVDEFEISLNTQLMYTTRN